MTLARITLGSGRDVELTHLEISSTYGGLLEGYPCAAINDRKLAALVRRADGFPPVHLIEPERTYPEAGSGRLPFGPVEVLPAVHCRGAFRARPVDDALDAVLYRSELTVVWFQKDLGGPVADFVTVALADLAWDDLAEDFEL
ncbi:hypothetical protein J4573_45710 [Actinomadura barringtoniae]|uniref:Uncharacterized protein n=1 Tax=Actinomadura barringtoniae TaxID=1427535 RepID=A0A939PLU5_9ACTN|nr:hypothetical protein [Actinomadura barringtoniae]MBO2454453.1 hypothetical protein [Actinomadura barringtoniae]